jgi:cytoskeletal protein CcmA (bactofilin family)
MALQSPFFNNNNGTKRDLHTETNALRPGNPSTPSTPTAAAAVPAAIAASQTGAASGDSESKLTVGPNIKLRGVEITDCDTLLVEGTVEATMDSRVIHITERGSFKGSAEIDIAEIRGLFDGSLTVREKLTIYSTGKVTGRIRYGKIVIEEGGQLSGEIEFGTQRTAGAASPRPLQQVTG